MASNDTSGNLGFWQSKLDAVIGGDHDPRRDTTELNRTRSEVLAELPVTVPETTRQKMEGVRGATVDQGKEVKDAFRRRKEESKPLEPNARGSVKHASAFDDSKLLRMEQDMAKRFADKVAMPSKSIRPSRVAEAQTAQVTDFCRGNELFAKRDFRRAMAEFAFASEVEQLRLFALLNRGNAYKGLKLYAEAIACYQDVLDAAGLDTPEGRLVHSYALNNLGAACQDDGRVEQARGFALAASAMAVTSSPRASLPTRPLLLKLRSDTMPRPPLRCSTCYCSPRPTQLHPTHLRHTPSPHAHHHPPLHPSHLAGAAALLLRRGSQPKVPPRPQESRQPAPCVLGAVGGQRRHARSRPAAARARPRPARQGYGAGLAAARRLRDRQRRARARRHVHHLLE